MKVRVIKRFNDRHTRERREENKVYEYPEEGAKELEASGYVQIVTADPKRK